MTAEYTFINQTDSIGTTILFLVNGIFQLGTAIVNKALDPTFGVVDLAAVGIALAVLAWMIANARDVKDNAAHII